MCRQNHGAVRAFGQDRVPNHSPRERIDPRGHLIQQTDRAAADEHTCQLKLALHTTAQILREAIPLATEVTYLDQPLEGRLVFRIALENVPDDQMLVDCEIVPEYVLLGADTYENVSLLHLLYTELSCTYPS